MTSPRPLTDQERRWLVEGLSTLRSGEQMGGGRWIEVASGKPKELDDPVDPAFFLDQIDNLKVVGECGCRDSTCATVYFQTRGTGKSAAIVCSATEDSRILIIHINEETGELVELEIC